MKDGLLHSAEERSCSSGTAEVALPAETTARRRVPQAASAHSSEPRVAYPQQTQVDTYFCAVNREKRSECCGLRTGFKTSEQHRISGSPIFAVCRYILDPLGLTADVQNKCYTTLYPVKSVLKLDNGK